jgi:hypothetical protein
VEGYQSRPITNHQLADFLFGARKLSACDAADLLIVAANLRQQELLLFEKSCRAELLRE